MHAYNLGPALHTGRRLATGTPTISPTFINSAIKAESTPRSTLPPLLLLPVAAASFDLLPVAAAGFDFLPVVVVGFDLLPLAAAAVDFLPVLAVGFDLLPVTAAAAAGFDFRAVADLLVANNGQYDNKINLFFEVLRM